MAALLAHHPCFQASRARPCGSSGLSQPGLFGIRFSKGMEDWRAAAEDSNALGKALGGGGHGQSSLKAGVWRAGGGRQSRLSIRLGCRRSSYSAALASAPSALPSTSSSEQSPVPFRTIRRVTTNGRSPRLWAEAEGQWGPAKKKWAAQYKDFKVIFKGKEAKDQPCPRKWTTRAIARLTCRVPLLQSTSRGGCWRQVEAGTFCTACLCSSLTSRQGEWGMA